MTNKIFTTEIDMTGTDTRHFYLQRVPVTQQFGGKLN